jgi:hypothetical protein
LVRITGPEDCLDENDSTSSDGPSVASTTTPPLKRHISQGEATTGDIAAGRQYDDFFFINS